MLKSILRDILKPTRPYTNEPQNTASLINKVMVMGSVMLFISAFIFMKNHSITALILGVIGIALLIAGATKKQQIYPATALPTMTLCKKCGANCELDWSYCAQCCSALTTHSDHVCSHCGMKIETDWKFCAHCRKEI